MISASGSGRTGVKTQGVGKRTLFAEAKILSILVSYLSVAFAPILMISDALEAGLKCSDFSGTRRFSECFSKTLEA